MLAPTNNIPNSLSLKGGLPPIKSTNLYISIYLALLYMILEGVLLTYQFLKFKKECLKSTPPMVIHFWVEKILIMP